MCNTPHGDQPTDKRAVLSTETSTCVHFSFLILDSVGFSLQSTHSSFKDTDQVCYSFISSRKQLTAKTLLTSAKQIIYTLLSFTPADGFRSWLCCEVQYLFRPRPSTVNVFRISLPLLLYTFFPAVEQQKLFLQAVTQSQHTAINLTLQPGFTLCH